MLPMKGVSMIDAPGQAFYGKDEDEALFDAIDHYLDKKKVELIKMDCLINDRQFGEAAAQRLIDMMNKQ